MELLPDPTAVVKLYVLVTACPDVVVNFADVGTYGEVVAYTVAMLVTGAPCTVENVVTTDDAAGDGDGAVYVTIIESAKT